MQKVITKCTSCGTMLEVRNPKNEALKKIKCPKCKCVLHVPFNIVPKTVDSAKTQLGTNSPIKEPPKDSAETQLGIKSYVRGAAKDSSETQLGPIAPPPIMRCLIRINRSLSSGTCNEL